MAKDNKGNTDISDDDQALLDAIALEEKEEADKKAALEAQEILDKQAEVDAKVESDRQQALIDQALLDAETFEALNEKSEFKIVILKATQHLREGKEHVVSGNIANILIKKGVAKLVEAMPEKSKTNLN